MEPPSPARLYATVAGALLVVLGIVCFFYDASFTALDELQPALGSLDVNAWFNLLYVVTGAIGVLVAGVASRPYALLVGLLYTLLGIFGLGTEWFHLTIGVLGLAAAVGTSREKRQSQPRAKAARNRA
jgi:hypothetical protein